MLFFSHNILPEDSSVQGVPGKRLTLVLVFSMIIKVTELKKLTAELKKFIAELKKFTAELKKFTTELKKFTAELKKFTPEL